MASHHPVSIIWPLPTSPRLCRLLALTLACSALATLTLLFLKLASSFCLKTFAQAASSAWNALSPAHRLPPSHPERPALTTLAKVRPPAGHSLSSLWPSFLFYRHQHSVSESIWLAVTCLPSASPATPTAAGQLQGPHQFWALLSPHCLQVSGRSLINAF